MESHYPHPAMLGNVLWECPKHKSLGLLETSRNSDQEDNPETEDASHDYFQYIHFRCTGAGVETSGDYFFLENSDIIFREGSMFTVA